MATGMILSVSWGTDESRIRETEIRRSQITEGDQKWHSHQMPEMKGDDKKVQSSREQKRRSKETNRI